jgi:hypothetical protein
MLLIWKKEIENDNEKLIIPRTPFSVRKKLRRGLKNCLNDITQILESASDRINDDFEFDATFQYTEYLMRKHIHKTIAPKEEPTSSTHKSGTVSKLEALKIEMNEILENRKLNLKIIEKMAEDASYLKEYMLNNPTLDDYTSLQDKLTGVLNKSNQSSINNESPYDFRTISEMKDWIQDTNIETWAEPQMDLTKENFDSKYEKVKANHDRTLQYNYADDAKRTQPNLQSKLLLCAAFLLR